MSMTKYKFICGIFTLPVSIIERFFSNVLTDRTEIASALEVLKMCKVKKFNRLYGIVDGGCGGGGAGNSQHSPSWPVNNYFEIVVEELIYYLDQKMLYNAKNSISILVEYFNVYKDTYFHLNCDTILVNCKLFSYLLCDE